MALPDLPPIADAPEAEYVASTDPYELDQEARALDSDLPEHAQERASAGHSKSPSPAGPPEPIDTRLVRRLADILKDTDLTEIEVEKSDLKIRVARQTALAQAPALASPQMVAPPPAVAAAAGAPTPSVATNEELRGEVVKSPMVGAVYLQAQPGAKRFVQAGEQVTAGQTLLIIEAMKTMNPVPAPKAGTVLKVLVEDGQPVEFGEPLVVIE